MYDKMLALRIYKILKKKAKYITEIKDPFEQAITASEMISMLDLFAEAVKLDIDETINIISIKKEG